MVELIEGRRVRLLESIENGQYQRGDTGYLHEFRSGDWGVVLDKDLDDGMTHIQAETLDGRRVRLLNIVEYIQPMTDDDDTCPVQIVTDDTEETRLMIELARAHYAMVDLVHDRGADYRALIYQRNDAIEALLNHFRSKLGAARSAELLRVSA
jgi:hypothetical protein